MHRPLISVIVPVYKTEKFLQRCVDSIVSQTYRNLEIILVDDGSPDNSGELCDENAKKDTRIKVVHKENGGLSSARNAGLNIMTGKYVGFVDSDDWIETNMYEVLYSRMISENADISCCGIKICSDSSILNYFNSNLDENFTLSRREALRELNYNKKITGSVVDKLYKAEIFSNLRMKEGILYEDSQVQPYCINIANRITYVSNPLYCYYQSSGSILRSAYSSRHYDIIEIGLERIEFYKNNCTENLEYARMYHISNCLDVMYFSKDYDEWREKREHIKQYLSASENNNFHMSINYILKIRLIIYRICPWLYYKIVKLYSSLK